VDVPDKPFLDRDALGGTEQHECHRIFRHPTGNATRDVILTQKMAGVIGVFEKFLPTELLAVR